MVSQAIRRWIPDYFPLYLLANAFVFGDCHTLELVAASNQTFFVFPPNVHSSTRVDDDDNQAYIQETLAFCDCLVNDKPSPCSGEDGLMALIMAIAAGKSAEEGRWVR